MTTARMPSRARRVRPIPDPQACELDNVVGLHGNRVFGPAPKRRRDWTALGTVVAIVLVAFGCALIVTSGNTLVASIGP